MFVSVLGKVENHFGRQVSTLQLAAKGTVGKVTFQACRPHLFLC